MILTKASQASLCKEIPTELLPRSNQDAIQITRNLGIQYLWIDALCILQDLDDPSDWFKESAKMGDIYRFAYVTISASQASTGKEGCFAEYQPLEARLVTSRSLTKSSTQQKQIERKPQIGLKDFRPIPFVDDSTPITNSSEIAKVLPESREPETLKELRWQELQDQGENQIDPTNTSRLSMLTSEEVILEMLVRQELLYHPNSNLLHTLHDGLMKCQYTREQEAKKSRAVKDSKVANGTKAEKVSNDLISANILNVYSKEVGKFGISGIRLLIAMHPFCTHYVVPFSRPNNGGSQTSPRRAQL